MEKIQEVKTKLESLYDEKQMYKKLLLLCFIEIVTTPLIDAIFTIDTGMGLIAAVTFGIAYAIFGVDTGIFVGMSVHMLLSLGLLLVGIAYLIQDNKYNKLKRKSSKDI